MSYRRGRNATIGKILSELRRSRDAAKAANRAKSEFLANMSHEIRTPLNSVIALAEYLDSNSGDEREHEYLAAIRTSATSLLALLNDLLDLSSLETGSLSLDRGTVHVRSIVDSVVAALAVAAFRRGIGLDIDIDPELPASLVLDGARFRQILLNIVGNGVKFTDEGRVVVRVRKDITSRGKLPPPRSGRMHLVVEVEDTGIGIPADRLDAIFDAFNREQAETTKRYGGRGLGLTLSRKLVELMGGTITVTSAPDQGSTFTVIIPDVEVVPGAEEGTADIAGFCPEAITAEEAIQALRKSGNGEAVLHLAERAATLLDDALCMPELKAFAADLRQAGQESGLREPVEFSTCLAEEADCFNIEGLQDHLRHFVEAAKA